MDWIVFSASLPASSRSAPRVTLWRRLRRSGAINPTGGMHILPDREECTESFQWLAQEIRHAGGEAVVMHVARLDGMTDHQLIEMFQSARSEEYALLNGQVADLEQKIAASLAPDDREGARGALDKLRRRYAEVRRVDYFDCPEGRFLPTRLSRIEHAISEDALSERNDDADVPSALIADYRSKSWVTRPRPHVDRLACAWLIRRFIDSAAAIRYSEEPAPGEVLFDMPDTPAMPAPLDGTDIADGIAGGGSGFGHIGSLCTFETMIRAFGLEHDPALQSISEIVHEIDLRDGQHIRAETEGVAVILGGWLVAQMADEQRESHGVALFEGLYAALSVTSDAPETSCALSVSDIPPTM